MKQYARIKDYGDVLIPVALLEKVVAQGYLVRTDYVDNKEILSEVYPILNVAMHDEKEVNAVLAQQMLEGK